MTTSKEKSTDRPQPVLVKERLTRHILRTLMANFSSLADAILELVDNAFDEFDNKHGGNHLDIRIILSKSSVLIENVGGKGMGVNELQSWLSWGEPHKKDAIGEYGQGGKAAMGYIGSSWVVTTKRWDESYLWVIKENNWDEATGIEKSYKAEPKIDEGKEGLGYCRFEIRKLKKHRQDKKRIIEVLSNTYRKYLLDGQASITLNDEPILPLNLPIYDGYQIQEFKEKTPQGITLKGWIGRLKRDVRVRGGQRINGGIRLLRKNRLICDGEYFGHPDFRYRASLGTLIGEVDFSKIPVLPNKTGFDTDSETWHKVKDCMHEILKPHIEELLNQKEEETVTREEKKVISQVRNIMIEALRNIDKYQSLSARFAEDRGRKPPESKNEETAPIKTIERTQSKERQPKTPPPQDAIGKLQRLGRMPEWEIRILSPDIRSDWEITEGKRCLLINKHFCLYEERDGDELYIAETAAIELAKPEEDEKISLENYQDEVNLLLRAFCEVYENL